MDTDAIIRRLAELGISMIADGQRLRLQPGSRLPEDMHDEVRRHKSELLGRISSEGPSDPELADIVRRVREQGYVLLWSNVLEDAVAFIASDKDADVLPPGFVPYTLDELLQLFGDECLSADSLRSVHRVKKHDRTIKDVQL